MSVLNQMDIAEMACCLIDSRKLVNYAVTDIQSVQSSNLNVSANVPFFSFLT